jgi:opacity protein-like surface antigen
MVIQIANADAEKGAYLGGGVGEVKVKIDDLDSLVRTIVRYDATDTAYKILAGWRFNPYVAAELSYVNLGRPNAAILPGVLARTRVHGLAPHVVVTMPVGPYELFAKAGYLFCKLKVDVASPFSTASSSASDQTFTYSAGVGVNAFNRLNLRLEYEEIDIKSFDDLHSVWLTAAVRF